MRDSVSRFLIQSLLASALICCLSVATFAQQTSNDESPAQTSSDTSNAAPGETEGEDATETILMRTARFLGVTPGKTTLADVKEKLGDPRSEQVSSTSAVLEYQVGPFPKVEIFLLDDVVVSVLAQLNENRVPSDLAKELGWDSFKPVEIRNADEALGLAYPERGVLFTYAADSPRPRVAQILIEPLSAEMFLLRVEASPANQFSQQLADLERVLDFDPKNSEALWRGAKLLAITGKQNDALKLVKQAVRLSPDNDQYQLTQAKFTARAGDHKGAVVAVERLLERSNITASIRAAAELELGNLMTTGLNRDYKAAVEHHLAAVKAATPLVSDPDALTRHAAERVLVDAYLGAANDIAHGNWDRKSEVVPKWLRSAEELATGFVQNDSADPIMPLLVWRRTLEAYAAMDVEVVDVPVVVEAAQQTGNALIEESDDPIYKQHVRWELLQANFAALRVEQTRGRYSPALKYAGEAVRLVEELSNDRTANLQTRYMIGRLYFYVGSIYAINHKDHPEAVRWYERALPHFDGVLPKTDLYDTGIHGERFVSMGVSYWKADAGDEALKLTERGLDLMERATKAGLLDQQTLIVPYANLAEMHRVRGRSDEAEEFSAKVARLKDDQLQR